MSAERESEWSVEDLDFVRSEVHKENPAISRALIELLVGESRRRIGVAEGRVKLLSEARRCLRRRLERRQERHHRPGMGWGATEGE